MSEPITMDYILALIGVVLAVESLLKAIEWGICKITAQHDKSQKIDENAESLEDYKKKTDKTINDLTAKVMDSHKNSTNALSTLEKNITNALIEQRREYVSNLKDDKQEYIDGIRRVENSITEMQAMYQQTVAVMDVKIDNLEKAQNKHNNLIERMYKVEKQSALHEQEIKVANHRIEDLEKK